MVDFASTALGAAIAWSVNTSLSKTAENGENGSNGEGGNGTETETNGETMVSDPVEQRLADLYGLERRNRAGQDALPGYVGTVVSDLADSATATVKITPAEGMILRVKRLEFDRRSDHDYTFEIGGTTYSENHRLVFQAPQKVSYGQPIVATATNNSGDTTSFDFEGEMWGFPVGGKD